MGAKIIRNKFYVRYLLFLVFLLIKGGAWVLGDALAEAFPVAFTVISVLVIATGAVFEEGCGCGCLAIIVAIIALIFL